MQITVNLIDLLLALLIMVGIALGIFLVVLIVRLIQTLKRLSQLSTDLHGPLTQTADQLPALIQRIDTVSTDVSVLVKSANENVPAILDNTKAITGTARTGVEAVGSAAEGISSGVTSFFSPSQDRSGSFSSIIEIVGQVFQIVGLFTHKGKSKRKKSKKSRRR